MTNFGGKRVDSQSAFSLCGLSVLWNTFRLIRTLWGKLGMAESWFEFNIWFRCAGCGEHNSESSYGNHSQPDKKFLDAVIMSFRENYPFCKQCGQPGGVQRQIEYRELTQEELVRKGLLITSREASKAITDLVGEVPSDLSALCIMRAELLPPLPSSPPGIPIIDKLSAAQEGRLRQFRDESLEIDRSMEPLNREVGIDLINEVYRRCGETQPIILFFSSPAMCIRALEDLRAVADEILPPITKGSDRNVASDLWGRLENALQRYSIEFRTQVENQLRSEAKDKLESHFKKWRRLHHVDLKRGGQYWNLLERGLRNSLAAQLSLPLRTRLETELLVPVWHQLQHQLRRELRNQLLNEFGTNRTGFKELHFEVFSGEFLGCDVQVFYKFCQELGVRYEDEDSALLDLWINFRRALHWWLPRDGIVFISERPRALRLDEQGRLHSDTDMACKYSDGWGFYAQAPADVAEPDTRVDSPDEDDYLYFIGLT